MRIALPLIVLAGLAGCSTSTGTGTFTNAITGEPIGDMRIVAKATGKISLSCAAFETTTDAAGKFSFDSLCGGTPYALAPADENYWLAEFDEIPDGGAENIDLKAWHTPKGSGMYVLHKGELKAIKTSADIKVEPIWNNDTEMVSYPGTLPKKPALIPADGYLVLVGQGAVTKTLFNPLIPSETRKFGNAKTSVITMQPWSYIGVAFTSDSVFERKTAAPDAAKILKKEKGDRITSWIPGSALPGGRYAVHKEKDKRTTVIDFGAPPK